MSTPISLSSVLPSAKRRRWPVLVIVVAVLIVALGVGGYLLLRPGSINVNGTVELGSSSNVITAPPQCAGSGGYSDLRGGAQVVITDSAGATLALSQLEAGVRTRTFTCSLAFSATVPTGKGFYGIQVGTRNRLQASEADLGKPLAFAIGS